MNKITCCKDCADRKIACHDSCERYKAQKAAYEETKNTIYEQKEKERALDHVVERNKLRRKKIKHEMSKRK